MVNRGKSVKYSEEDVKIHQRGLKDTDNTTLDVGVDFGVTLLYYRDIVN